MFSALAAKMAVRRRGLPSGSPPPFFAAMVISLIRRVNILPRLASSAPFLCLIVAHLEWPDMGTSIRRKNAARDLRRPCEYITGNGRQSGAFPAPQPHTLTRLAKVPYSRIIVPGVLWIDFSGGLSNVPDGEKEGLAYWLIWLLGNHHNQLSV